MHDNNQCNEYKIMIIHIYNIMFSIDLRAKYHIAIRMSLIVGHIFDFTIKYMS